MTIDIFDRWVDARKAAAAPQQQDTSADARPHGLAPSQVEAMRDRFEQFMPRVASSHPSHRAAAFFDKMLPPGANLDPSAGGGLARAEASARMRRTGSGNMPYGSNLSSNQSFSSGQRPYQPEFDSPDRQCHLEGSPVTMADGTFKPVEDVRVGERVLDKYGHVQVVEEAWSSGVPEEITEIRLWGGTVLRVTNHHNFPAWVWVRKCLCGCGGAVAPGACYLNHHAKKKGPKLVRIDGTERNWWSVPEGYAALQKIHAEDLQAYDCLLMPRTFDVVATDVYPELARLLGYYAAEGSVQNERHVKFSFHTREVTSWVRDIQDIWGEAETTVGYEKDTSGCFVYTKSADSSDFAAWVTEHAGRGSADKRLSETVMCWPLDLKEELIRGYLRGDGYQGGREVNEGKGTAFVVSCTSISEALIGQLQLVLAQLGYPARRYTTPAYVDNAGVAHRESYQLEIGGQPARRLADLVWGAQSKANEFPARIVCEGLRTDEQFVYIPIREVVKVKNDKRVYNLTVSGDHSYLVWNIGTYNSYPMHRNLANIYWRIFYKMDPVIGTGIDLLGDMCWSSFQLTGVDGEPKEMFEEMLEESQFRAMLPHLVREFMVIGEVAPHLFWDDDRSMWTYIALHNPDQLEVIWAPFAKMEPVVEFRPEDRLRQVMTSNHPMLQKVRDQMPKDVLNALTSGQNIPLSSINCTFLPRRLHPYDVRGTSVLSRMWRILMYEDGLFAASLAVARRAAAPLKVAKLGDKASGWIPDPSAERRLLELLVQAESDPAAWIVYNYGVEFDLVGSQERTWKIEQSSEFIERVKLMALGVSKSFLWGETTYASAASGLTVFLQRLRAMREYFETMWIYPKIFKQMSEMNRWVKPTEAELAHGVRTKRSKRELKERYIVPQIMWDRPLDPSIDSSKISAIQTLSSLGVKFSRQTMSSMVNIDSKRELESIIREYKEQQALLAKHPEMQMVIGAPASPEGGGGGGGVLPGIPPSAMGMDEGGGEGGAPPPGAPGEPGAPLGGDETGLPPTADAGDNEPHGGTAAWSNEDGKRSVADLVSMFNGDGPDEEVWQRMLGEWRKAAKTGNADAVTSLRAWKSGDPDAFWEKVEDWLLAFGGYPAGEVRGLEAILRKSGTLKSPRNNPAVPEMTGDMQALASLVDSGDSSFYTGFKSR